ncbi:hypothetical protein GCM10023195_81200 [Actinoallomurus liliacearum]|uniref:Uncharacterized protein n=1 Tax=Actinoallomurus liliacearum TaxID=1080073 RepID=A0ABP8TZQ0_9ACTN
MVQVHLGPPEAGAPGSYRPGVFFDERDRVLMVVPSDTDYRDIPAAISNTN